MYVRYIKRILDILVSFISLILLSPLMIIISALIKFTSEGPIIFKQKRIGRNKKVFTIYKFRSMYTNAPSEIATENLGNAEAHITKIGKIIRVTSLDELPQLINILLGDMSIVGPRPALWNQYKLIELRDKVNANSLRPGLTGWAQVNGRDELDEKDKAKLDGWYVQNISIFLDVKCFILTIVKVIKKEGIKDSRVERQTL